MRTRVFGPIAFLVGLLGLVVAAAGWAQQLPSPLERYRNLEFPPKNDNFDKGWKDRVALESEIINAADLKSLRVALKDSDPFVRAMAARALGILADKASADALAEMANVDPEYFVRIRAVDALGFLKMKPEAIELAKKDRDPGVQWTARIAAGHFKSAADDAAHVRQAYAAGIKREAMGSAQVGRPAPDFSAQTSDGKPFKLSSVLGKKPIAIYFAAFEG